MLKICYLLKTVFKSKRIVIFKISKNYSRAKEKYARTQQKSECYHYTEPRGILTSLYTQPSKTTQHQHPIPLVPEHKKTLLDNKCKTFQNKTTRLTKAFSRLRELKDVSSFYLF